MRPMAIEVSRSALPDASVAAVAIGRTPIMRPCPQVATWSHTMRNKANQSRMQQSFRLGACRLEQSGRYQWTATRRLRGAGITVTFVKVASEPSVQAVRISANRRHCKHHPENFCPTVNLDTASCFSSAVQRICLESWIRTSGRSSEIHF